MTQQFDEGVKEILMTLLSLGATMYETDYVLDQLNKRPEPIEQKIQAVQIVDKRVDNKRFDTVSKQVINQLKKEPTIKKAPKPIRSSDDTREDRAYNMLTNGGLTHVAAIGIIANLQAESKLDPTTKQIAKYKPVIKYGPGRGLAQWEKGGRFDTDRINLVNFASKRGKDWTDFDTQIEFILHELNVHPEYKRVKELLNNSKTIEEAIKIFLNKYEKAGIPHLGNRLQYGKNLQKKYDSYQASN
jgi:hypothetical protein